MEVYRIVRSPEQVEVLAIIGEAIKSVGNLRDYCSSKTCCEHTILANRCSMLSVVLVIHINYMRAD